MLTVVLGLSSAFVFGAADFLGGTASKRMNPLRVTATVAFAGLIVLLVAAVFVGGTWSRAAVLWGSLSGVSGAIAISLLYSCLAIGPMSILSPLTAVVSAMVPMAAGLLKGERLGLVGYVALGIALVAVVLVGFVPEKGAVRPSRRGLLMAVASGAMIGVFMILIDLTPKDSGLVPLILNRSINGVIMCLAVVVVAMMRRRKRDVARTGAGTAAATTTPESAAGPGKRTTSTTSGQVLSATMIDEAADAGGRWWLHPIAIASAAGSIDAMANTVLLLAIRTGDLTVVSVLSAMYPAGTIILASIVLHERIAPVQILGLVLALGSAGMLALA